MSQVIACPYCHQPCDQGHECEYRFTWVEEYLKLPRNPNKWIVQDLVPVGGITNIYAKPKLGKTFVFMGMGAAIANGDDEWEGFEIQTPGKVMFLEVDTPREEMADRFQKMAINNQSFAIADMWQVPDFPYNILQPKMFNWFQQEVQRINPVMVVIDTIREVHEQDENDSTGMKKVLGQLIAACRPAAVVLISHSRKDGNNMFTVGSDSDIMDENRGSNYVAGKADVVIRLTKKTMTYKGRATGQVKLSIKQDEHGFVQVVRDDNDEQFKLIKDTMALHPGESTNRLAERISKMTNLSVRTATRRVNYLKEQMTNAS